jgi:hypothetical protein
VSVAPIQDLGGGWNAASLSAAAITSKQAACTVPAQVNHVAAQHLE